MKIKPNINLLNALIRITLGLTILAWSTAKLVKQPWRDSFLLAALCGAMKVAEGIVRYCPVTALYEKCQEMMPEKSGACGCDSDSNPDSMDGMEGLTNLSEDQGASYNPT